MASYTDKRNVVNHAHLIEPIMRHRIQDSLFYKQHLHLTNEATIVPVIVEHVKWVGGSNSIGKPSAFICCLLRLLELDLSEEILTVYLEQMGYNEFKYLTAMTALYVRLVKTSAEVYEILDPYYTDSRKLRFQLKTPRFDDQKLPIYYEIKHMDEWVDSLIEQERVVDIILPRLVPRQVLVEKQLVKPRTYHIENEDAEESSEYESDSD